MDSFKTEHRIYDAMSDFDVATWVVTSRVAKPAANFAKEIDEMISEMSDIDDDEVVVDPIDIS